MLTDVQSKRTEKQSPSLLALIEAKPECEVYWALLSRKSALFVDDLITVCPATACTPCYCSACSRLFFIKQVWLLQKHCLCDSIAGSMPGGSHQHQPCLPTLFCTVN